LIPANSVPRQSGTRFKSIFSYYGGKSRIAHLYPAPVYGTIVEPFCGAAAYSALHYDRQVHLYDADPVTASIWQFLLSPNALDHCRFFIPDSVQPGMCISDFFTDYPDAPPGLIRLMQAEANAGTQGARGVHDQITKFGAGGWPRFLPKMEYWIPRIQHWTFTHVPDYTLIPNRPATWFIDPPYNNPAGARYRTQISDYNALAGWCLSRLGQVIVCENEGADWLPFTVLAPRRGVFSSYQKSQIREAVWVK